MKGWRGILLVGSLLFIATATLTPGDSSGTFRPDFWCLACGFEGGADVTLNFALFLPLGVAMALLGVVPVRALIIGMLLSMSIELAQRQGLATDRVASATDIITNTAGAFAGALIGRYRTLWLQPTPGAARILASIGAFKVCVFLAFTAWALSPDNSINRPSIRGVPFQVSQFPFTPGYGWYHGRVSEATIDDLPFAHAGDGPVILRGELTEDLRGSVQVSGRDERTEFVPLLYVHDIRVANPELMIGQQGTGARMHVNLRGRKLRFPGPSIFLRDAFLKQVPDTQTLSFSVTPRQWTLSSASIGKTRNAALPISLSLGWTMLQTVLHVGDRGAWAISLGWLFAMWLPVGYWCVFAGRNEPTRPVIAGGSVLILALWLLPQVGTIAACSPLEWGSAISGMACGVFFATRSRTRLREARATTRNAAL